MNFEVGKGLEICTASENSGWVMVEMTGTWDGTTATVRGKAMVPEVTLTIEVLLPRLLTMIGTGTNSVALSRTMKVTVQVTVVPGKVSENTERAIRDRGRTMVGRSMVAAKRDLVAAEVLLEVEMSLLAEKKNMAVAERALVMTDLNMVQSERDLDVGVVTAVIEENLPVPERVLVVAEGMSVADHSLKLIETGMLVPRKDLVQKG